MHQGVENNTTQSMRAAHKWILFLHEINMAHLASSVTRRTLLMSPTEQLCHFHAYSGRHDLFFDKFETNFLCRSNPILHISTQNYKSWPTSYLIILQVLDFGNFNLKRFGIFNKPNLFVHNYYHQ